MKLFLIFIVTFISGSSFSQSAAGFPNIVTLGEKDGFPGYLYVFHQRSPSGKLYSVTYNGDVYINSNNSVKKIELLNGLSGAGGYFHFPDSATCWYYNTHGVAIIQHDTLYKTISVPGEIISYLLTASGKLHYFKNTKESTILYEFAGEKFRQLKTFPAFTENNNQTFFDLDIHNKLWHYGNKKGELRLALFDEQTTEFILKKSYAVTVPLMIRGLVDENNFLANRLTDGKLIKYFAGKPIPTNYGSGCGNPDNLCANTTYYPYAVLTKENGLAEVLRTDLLKDSVVLRFRSDDPVSHMLYDSITTSWYGFCNNKPVQFFSYLKYFPFLFGNNSSSVFSLAEDAGNRIWAASYRGGAAVIENNIVLKLADNNLTFLNGSASHHNYHYLISEKPGTGLLQYNSKGNYRKLTPGTLGYYVHVSRDKKFLYYGTSGNAGLWQASVKSVEAGNPEWNKIDSSKGIALHNILTITDDTLGRIWCGHPKRGIAIYNPVTNTAASWLIEKKQAVFGAFASITDQYGTVWMGSNDKGLWYYNDYTKPAAASSCTQIQHPLLNTGKAIRALAIFNNWLVISATDKMLLLNIDSFYQKKKIVLRYLNPREAGFTSVTEQNTLLVSRKDSTVWFSTGDMLYQWDLKKWLSIPTYQVKPAIQLTAGTVQLLVADKKNFFNPGTQNFDINLYYHSPDLMPRYTRAALIKEGDSLLLPEASLQDKFSFKNIESGRYNFIVEIFETDGNTSVYIYRIIIRKHLWEHWWFWALISSIIIGTTLYFLNIRRKKQLAEQMARTKEAELHTFKAEQEKKLADLRLVSLSSQFRPHFILNALNTIGAQMDDNPETETVLSRLGESVSLIFNHAKNQKTLHSFENEWKLVLNIIQIHRLMYLKQLEATLPADTEIEKIKDLQLPMGLLQIPVENALLHGLSNREQGPWKLSVAVADQNSNAVVSITDNGIGRKKSATLSNHTKHGTGTKNLNEVIKIINSASREKISVRYEDNINEDGSGAYGTAVIIAIPKHLDYEER